MRPWGKPAWGGGFAASGMTATAAVLAAGSLLVFWLPWRVPVRGGIESDSSLFGFSNAAAIAGLGLTLLGLMAIRLVTPGAAGLLRGLVGPAAPASPAERSWLVLGIGVAAVVIGGWWSLLPYAFFGESTYFLTRLDMLQYGFHPYRDFDFGYGPALLLVPAAIHWGSGRLVAMDTAYVFTVIAHTALGLAATSAILRRICRDASLRRGLFAFVLLASLNISLGVMSAVLRLVYPPWAALVFHESHRGRRSWVGWATAFLLPFDGFQISPDTGVATTVAVLVGLAFAGRGGRLDLLPRVVAVLAAPAVFLGVFGTESLATLVSFGSGGLNFPILPAPYMLSVLGLACFLLPALGAAAIRGGDESAPATASLAVALGMLLPPALGRCDPGHVLGNSLGLAIVTLAATAAHCGRAPRRLATAAVVVMFLTSSLSAYVGIGRIVTTALEARRFVDREADVLAAADAAVLTAIGGESGDRDFGWSKRPPFDPSLLELTRFDAIATPLGAHEGIDRFLKLSGRYVPVRHVPPYAGLGDRRSAERMAADAMRCEHVLLPPQQPPVTVAAEGVRRSLAVSVLFGLPVAILIPPANEPFSSATEVQRIVREAYDPVAEYPPYEILRRRGAGAAGGR